MEASAQFRQPNRFSDRILMAEDIYSDGAYHAARVGGVEARSHFQAIFAATTGELAGHEALLRASMPDGVALSPQSAFHIARSEDRLVDLDRTSRTLHLMNYLRYPIPDGLLLFLNVNPGLVTEVSDHGHISELVSEKYGFAKNRIVIEIIENAATSNTLLERATRNYRRRGFQVAIDDFGSENSNFDRLWRLEPDIVKLDGRLFRDLSANPRATRIVTKVIEIIHEIGARAIIEGIETEVQANLAVEAGADMLQGYYFDRPAKLPRQI